MIPTPRETSYAPRTMAEDPGNRAATERRRLARPVFWEYAVAEPSGPGSAPFEVRIIDASDAGVGFRSPRPLAVGQELTLTLLKLDVTGSVLRCRVVHCTPAGGGFSVGAAIVQ